LKDAAGEEVLANAAGIVAMFTAMTMVVDAPGRADGLEVPIENGGWYGTNIGNIWVNMGKS
jgi:hypothetical protein